MNFVERKYKYSGKADAGETLPLMPMSVEVGSGKEQRGALAILLCRSSQQQNNLRGKNLFLLGFRRRKSESGTSEKRSQL